MADPPALSPIDLGLSAACAFFLATIVSDAIEPLVSASVAPYSVRWTLFFATQSGVLSGIVFGALATRSQASRARRFAWSLCAACAYALLRDTATLAVMSSGPLAFGSGPTDGTLASLFRALVDGNMREGRALGVLGHALALFFGLRLRGLRLAFFYVAPQIVLQILAARIFPAAPDAACVAVWMTSVAFFLPVSVRLVPVLIARLGIYTSAES